MANVSPAPARRRPAGRRCRGQSGRARGRGPGGGAQQRPRRGRDYADRGLQGTPRAAHRACARRRSPGLWREQGAGGVREVASAQAPLAGRGAAPDRRAADQQGARRGGDRRCHPRHRPAEAGDGAGPRDGAPGPAPGLLHPGQYRRRGAEGRRAAGRPRHARRPLPGRADAARDRAHVHPAGRRGSRPALRMLRALAARHGLARLSMGMSADYRAAVAAGATHIRVGTAIFGPRPLP